MKALLIVDVQKDFLPGGALEVPSGDEVITVINYIQNKFLLIVATQDWHPEGHESFASQHREKGPMDRGEVNGEEQVLWPDHCVQGTKGAEFADELEKLAIEAIFRKGTKRNFDSYSGFYDLGHEHSTGLTGYLRAKKVEKLYVAGLAADVCVKFTALDAVKEGFDTYVLKDATRAVNLQEGDYSRALSEMESAGVHIITSDQL